jgi:undecaprenyl phosphate N,N'-diacetylbacillosamine 1-phosphate transferase
MSNQFYYVIKRSFDLIFSVFLIITFIPLFFLISLAIYFFLGTPIFFEQKRIGKDLKIFRLYKFRTMTISTPLLKNDFSRLTPFGSFLRLTSLDEIPQLFNILKGDMSFVGPRPLLEEYLAFFDEDQLKRHLVKPGLTGYAQINGRNISTWDVRFKHDLWYVKHKSFFIDLLILFKTFLSIFNITQINSKNKQTMSDFRLSKYNKFKKIRK